MSEQNAGQSSSDSGSLLSESAGSDIWEAQHLLAPTLPDPLLPSAPEALKEATWVVSPDLQGPAAESVTPAPRGCDGAEQASEALKADDAGVDGTEFDGEVFGKSAADHEDTMPAAADFEPAQEIAPKRRLSALAAVVALATVAGAMSGALATAALWHFAGNNDVGAAGNSVVETSVARIDADIAALKSSLEHTARLASAQSGRTGERLDKLEKTQAEPAAKLARLSEAVDKLRAASVAMAPASSSPAAIAPAAAKEATGSIQPATAASKGEVARLPTVAGWTLRDVANGSALIQSRQGLFEVYAGDAVPGLGRIDAIRRQDGRWVVVTAKGLIVTR